jgi:hypothetical protein
MLVLLSSRPSNKGYTSRDSAESLKVKGVGVAQPVKNTATTIKINRYLMFLVILSSLIFALDDKKSLSGLFKFYRIDALFSTLFYG